MLFIGSEARQTRFSIQKKAAGFASGGFRISWIEALQQWHHQQRNNVDDLDQRVDRRASRIFVRIAYGVARDCSFVSVRALAAKSPRPGLKRSLYLRRTAALQSKKKAQHTAGLFLDPFGVAPT